MGVGSLTAAPSLNFHQNRALSQGESNLQKGTTLLCVIVGGVWGFIFFTPRTTFRAFSEQIFGCTALHTVDIFS